MFEAISIFVPLLALKLENINLNKKSWDLLVTFYDEQLSFFLLQKKESTKKKIYL
jgi:hypothetical protein